MKSRHATAAAALALVVATGLLGLETHSSHTHTDRQLRALDDFDRTQAELQRDAISLRTGLLGQQQPLGTDAWRLLAAADRLARETQGGGREALGARIEASAARQAELATRLRNDSMLLAQSVERFEERGAPPDPAASVQAAPLAAAMLRLSVDGGSEARQEAVRQLEALQAAAPSETGRRLLAHGGLVHRLLSRSDETVHALLAADPAEAREALRAQLEAERDRHEAVARRWRLGLLGLSLTMLVLLLSLGSRLKRHVERLRRKARLEHLIAEVSAALIQAPPDQVGAVAKAALGRIARALAAKRAVVCGSGADDLDQSWAAAHADAAARDWPARLRKIVRADLPERGARLLTSGQPDVPALAALMGEAKLRSVALAWTSADEGEALVMSFESTGALLIDAEELEVLRLALDAIGGALLRARLERSRAELERRLEAAGRMESMGAFASGIAHNFNNILGAVGGYAEMAARRDLPRGDLVRHLGQIRTAVGRAQRLVDRILAFGRRRGGAPALVDIAELIEESVSLLQAAHGPSAAAGPAERPSLQVLGDAAELQQVLLNLGANAIQASLKAVVRLDACAAYRPARRLLCGVELPAGAYALLSVADEGVGVEPRLRAKIFEPFFTTREEGHGLGLATVAQIVREHGGAIVVISAPGRGSRFNVYLPLAQGHAAEPASGRRSAERLLILASTPEELAVMSDIVVAQGLEPAGFTDVETALETLARVRKSWCGVLICHPEAQTALSWGRQMRRAAPHAPIVLSTAARGDLDAEAARLGQARLVRWPADYADVAAALLSKTKA